MNCALAILPHAPACPIHPGQGGNLRRGVKLASANGVFWRGRFSSLCATGPKRDVNQDLSLGVMKFLPQ